MRRGTDRSAASVSTTTLADTTSPTVALTAPANNATITGTTPITATATDNVGVVGVQFTLDGAPLGPEDTSAPFATTWATAGLANGPHQLAAIARDAAGNTATAATVTVTVTNADTTAPTAPGNLTATPTETAVTLTWAASTDNEAVTGYEVQRGSVVVATVPGLTYTDPGRTPATAYAYTVTAVDAAGNRSPAASVSTTTLADTAAPTVAITAPATNATITGTTPITATATDNVGVVGVQFTVDGATVGAEDTSAPFATTWATAGLANGPYQLAAIARDAAGNTATAATVTVTVTNADTTAPDGAGQSDGDADRDGGDADVGGEHRQRGGDRLRGAARQCRRGDGAGVDLHRRRAHAGDGVCLYGDGGRCGGQPLSGRQCVDDDAGGHGRADDGDDGAGGQRDDHRHDADHRRRDGQRRGSRRAVHGRRCGAGGGRHECAVRDDLGDGGAGQRHLPAGGDRAGCGRQYRDGGDGDRDGDAMPIRRRRRRRAT